MLSHAAAATLAGQEPQQLLTMGVWRLNRLQRQCSGRQRAVPLVLQLARLVCLLLCRQQWHCVRHLGVLQCSSSSSRRLGNSSRQVSLPCRPFQQTLGPPPQQ
jgi:hypothetical protein